MEFQAVILCGPGKKLHPITTGTCKALLPVGNKPLIQYVIEWCKKAGFAGTTVAVWEDDFEDVEAVCHAFELKVSLFKVQNDIHSGQILKVMESAGALKPQRDIMVVPCDFITEIDPESLISAVRSQDDNTAVTGFYYKNTWEKLDLKKLEPDVLLHSVSHPSKAVITSNNSSEYLLDCYEREKLKEAKVLKTRMAMLWKFPQVVATMDLLRSSIFFMSRKILGYEDINFDQPIAKVIRDIGRRTWRHHDVKETVVMQRLPSSIPFLRANNLLAYMEANHSYLRQKARNMHQQQVQQEMSGGDSAEGDHVPAKREPGQAMIGNDSLVGLNTSVGERSNVKRSAIGNNCTIGRKCHLTGCVILDNVTIENDVRLENCIVGKGATIEGKSKLVLCYVEGKYTVVSETEAKDEVLKGLSLGELDDEELDDMYESLSESEDSDEDDESSENDYEDDGEDDLFDRS